MFNDKIVFNYMYNLWVAVISDLKDKEVEEIGQELQAKYSKEYNDQNDTNLSDDDFIDMVSNYTESIREQAVSDAEEDVKNHKAPKFIKSGSTWNV
ncbi:hypothetical protein [Apilactobacillus timberlakei]|uniref:Uncharacterized protein n=1 Tax=Apilactobacillus timberlakei TaxID=2008380 RepID=A0ABY2YZF1_9LACO|nr:hypothetical protein [Apilactobacillus timberlakei]TPR14887.1 hypothetical protein DYZ97_01770 [Apilactobacillus timberlakei]TPR15857.1 hypothetical protein DY052_04570 [Apilactobacillus timberlakei]TPR16218.1 hypothetical protein DY048_01785 [Apilactobacillus timberlakei]TPR18961.1 hypothetical protein DY138_04930 [Apilactobacillus timberlakei]TPR20874.1 hypothetical protein DY061_02210 [Apilactobacillus timberlakei]